MSGSPVRETSCPSRKMGCRLSTNYAEVPLTPRRAGSWLVHSLLCGLFMVALVQGAGAQQALTWDQVKAKFEAVNPALKADADNVDEMRAEEITAFLRPNPQFTL